MELTEKLRKLDELKENKDSLEELIKETRREITELELEICEDAQNAMMHEVKIKQPEGFNYKYEMNFESVYSVLSSNSDHSKKVDLYRRLAELSGEEDKFQFFETANVHANTFKKIMKSLPHETIEQFIADGLMYVERKPSVVRRKVK